MPLGIGNRRRRRQPLGQGSPSAIMRLPLRPGSQGQQQGPLYNAQPELPRTPQAADTRTLFQANIPTPMSFGPMGMAAGVAAGGAMGGAGAYPSLGQASPETWPVNQQGGLDRGAMTNENIYRHAERRGQPPPNAYEMNLRQRQMDGSFGQPTPQLSIDELRARGVPENELADLQRRRESQGVLPPPSAVVGGEAAPAQGVVPQQGVAAQSEFDPSNPLTWTQAPGRATPITGQQRSMIAGTDDYLNQGNRALLGREIPGTSTDRDAQLLQPGGGVSGAITGSQFAIPPARPVPGSLGEMAGGGTRQRVPAGTAFGGGSRVAYREDGRPVLLPPEVASGVRAFSPPGQESNDQPINDALMHAYGRAAAYDPTGNIGMANRAGSLGIAYRGNQSGASSVTQDQLNSRYGANAPTVSQMEERRADVRQRRDESRPLPGFPRLPARVGEQGREDSMNNRRRVLGLPQLGGERTGGTGGPEGYEPGSDPTRSITDRQDAFRNTIGRHSGLIESTGFDPTGDIHSMESVLSGLDNPSQSDLDGIKSMIGARAEADEGFRDELNEILTADDPYSLQVMNLERANRLRVLFGVPPLDAPVDTGGYESGVGMF